eukprot:883872-Rhodomonas_salina.1
MVKGLGFGVWGLDPRGMGFQVSVSGKGYLPCLRGKAGMLKFSKKACGRRMAYLSPDCFRACSTASFDLNASTACTMPASGRKRSTRVDSAGCVIREMTDLRHLLAGASGGEHQKLDAFALCCCRNAVETLQNTQQPRSLPGELNFQVYSTR